MAAEEDTNLYHPEDSDDDGSAGAAKKNSAVSWTASEFIEHERGAGWYAALFVVTVALAAAIFLITHDYFAAAVIVILGIILAVYARNKPGQITYELNPTGLKVGQKPYAYSLFKSFSIIREGALSTITFYPLKRLSLPISIFFDAKEEGRIASLIGEHLPLEERGPDRFDDLTRRLKI